MKKSATFYVCLCILLFFVMAFFVREKKTVSDLENRTLEQIKKISIDSILSTNTSKNIDRYIEDHFPFRDFLLHFNSLYDRGMNSIVKNEVVMGKNARLFNDCSKEENNNLYANIQAIDKLSKAIDKPFNISVVPYSARIYEEYLPYGYKTNNDFFNIENTIENSNLKYIPILEELKRNKKYNLFYYTDHHWTANGALYGYKTIAKALNKNDDIKAKIKVEHNFKGSLYAKFVNIFTTEEDFSYWDDESLILDINGKKQTTIHDYDKLKSRDKYAALMHGNHGLACLTNKNANDTILIVKDSYANAILPLIANNYKKTYIVDLRFFSGNLINLYNEINPSDILFLYGEISLCNERSIAQSISSMLYNK